MLGPKPSLVVTIHMVWCSLQCVESLQSSIVPEGGSCFELCEQHKLPERAQPCQLMIDRITATRPKPIRKISEANSSVMLDALRSQVTVKTQMIANITLYNVASPKNRSHGWYKPSEVGALFLGSPYCKNCQGSKKPSSLQLRRKWAPPGKIMEQ